jgi:hypothetical protein
VAQHAAQPEHDLDDALRGGSGILEMESQLWVPQLLEIWLTVVAG